MLGFSPAAEAIQCGLLRRQSDVRIMLQHAAREVARDGFDDVVRLAGFQQPGDYGVS